MIKRLLITNRHRRTGLGNDGTQINTPRTLTQLLPNHTRQQQPQISVVEISEVPNRFESRDLQPLLRLRSDPRQRTQRPRCQEVLLLPRRHNHETDRLISIRRDLRDRLSRATTKRGIKSGLDTNLRLQICQERASLARRRHNRTQVEVALVDAGLFDNGHRSPYQ